MYEKIYSIVQSVDDLVWGWAMIVLLLGTHLFLTIRTGFIQRKTITKGIPLSVSKEDGADGEVSQFGALTTALASTIGTGNIIGVGTAIALGGPGAVLWCWLTGVFGIATKYSESLIAVKYRVKTADGRMQGGAMYALERGLNMKWLGMILRCSRDLHHSESDVLPRSMQLRKCATAIWGLNRGSWESLSQFLRPSLFSEESNQLQVYVKNWFRLWRFFMCWDA